MQTKVLTMVVLGCLVVCAGCISDPKIRPVVFTAITTDGDRTSVSRRSAIADVSLDSSAVRLKALLSMGTVFLEIARNKGTAQLDLAGFRIHPIREDSQWASRAGNDLALTLPQRLDNQVLYIRAVPDGTSTEEFHFTLRLLENGRPHVIEAVGRVDKTKQIGPDSQLE